MVVSARIFIIMTPPVPVVLPPARPTLLALRPHPEPSPLRQGRVTGLRKSHYSHTPRDEAETLRSTASSVLANPHLDL